MLLLFQTISLMVLAAEPSSGGESWVNDFALQPPVARPRLEVRYADAARTGFEIVGEGYQIAGSLQTPHRLTDPSSGKTLVSLVVIGEDGVEYTSEFARPPSRINLYRRGPYYCEPHWLDVQVATENGRLAPLKADVALYCYPDKVMASVTWHALTDFAAQRFEIRGQRPERFEPQFFAAGSSQQFSFTIISGNSAAKPLETSAWQNLAAAAPVQYDTLRGCYVVGSLNEGQFQEQFYEHPNRYEQAILRVTNDNQARTLYICHETVSGDKGCVEGAVLLDDQGNPLPILVQISKNFAGEKEEPFYNPSDAAFSETYFPLVLEPNETRTVTSLHLYQNWGVHPVKGFSSLGAWTDYFHSSTGVTETTCYVPFRFGGPGGIDIADFRAMSQHAFWQGQPQHDNVAGHRFLAYNNGKSWQHLVYQGTTYRSTGPNWADIRFDYESSDGAIRASLDTFELPQEDELRQFIHLHCDVIKPVIVRDAGENFRLITIDSKTQSLRQTHFAATGIDDTPLEFAKSAHPITACPLPEQNAFLAVYGAPKGGNAIILRNWHATAAGDPIRPIAAVESHPSGDTSLFLAADSDSLTLRPGDTIDLEAILIPFGATDSAAAPRREVRAYGIDAPRVISVTRGETESNFPTTIRARANQAEFTITGGRGTIPIIVTGLEDYRYPALYTKHVKSWRLLQQNLLSPVDGAQTFCGEDGFYGAVFLIPGGDTPQTLRVTTGRQPEFPDPIRLTAFRMPPKTEGPLSLHHAIMVQAPWMEKPIHLRFPESLATNTLDFADFKTPPDIPGPNTDSTPLAAEWQSSEGGSLWFAWNFNDKSAGGRLTPQIDCVDLECWLENRRSEPVPFNLQVCPILKGTIFEDPRLERTWVRTHGAWQRLSQTDRGPDAQHPLCHYRVRGTPNFEAPPPWVISRDTLDLGIIAVTAVNGRYTFALVWPDCPRVQTNTELPCVHADPPPYLVQPGTRFHLQGKLYLIDGTLDDLLNRIEREIMPLNRQTHKFPAPPKGEGILWNALKRFCTKPGAVAQP